MASSSTNFVLFYSDNCKYSREVLTSMQQRDIGKHFEMVDVLTSQVPSGVTSVPTVYDKSSFVLHKGQEVFNLLDKLGADELPCYEFSGKMEFSDVDFTNTSSTESYSWIS